MMRKYGFLIFLLFVCTGLTAQEEDHLPYLLSSLDWSADGQYLAVITTNGVYIHRSDDLSVVKVLNEGNSVYAIDWNREGYRLAYYDRQNQAITIYELETDEQNTFIVSDEERFRTTSIQWSPDDTILAFAEDTHPNRLALWHIATEQYIADILTEDEEYSYLMPLDWHPDGQQILTVQGFPDIAVRDYLRSASEIPVSLPISQEVIIPDRFVFTAKWDVSGTRIAAGWEHSMYIINAVNSEVIQVFEQPFVEYAGINWHPMQDKLVFFARDTSHSLPDRVIIWDLSTDSTVELMDVYNTQIEIETSHNAAQWNPDGSKLASVSIGDGRIIIWETENYEVIAEYDGYRSLVGDN